MTRARDAFFLVWALLSLLIQPGIFLDDEIGQAAGVISKSLGSPGVTGDVPPIYQTLGHGNTRDGLVPPPGNEIAESGSALVSVMALPAWFLLRGISAVVGTAATGAIVATLPAALLVHWQIPRMRWWVFAGVVLNAGLAALLGNPAPSAYLEVLAIQATTLATLSFGAAAFWTSVVDQSPVPSRLGIALLVGSPLLFWALNIKYHGMVIAFVLMALHALMAIWRSGWLAGAAFGGALGIIASLHEPSGLLAGAGLAGAAMALAWQERCIPWRGWLAAPLGAIVGLVPRFVEQVALARAGLRGNVVGSIAGGDVPAADVASEALRTSAALASRQVVDAVFDALLHIPLGRPEVGGAVPILVAAPFLLAALAGGWRRNRWLAVAMLQTGITFAIGGSRLLANGDGYDLRHLAPLWPAWLAAAAPQLARGWDSRWLQAGALWFLVVAAAQWLLRAVHPTVALPWLHAYTLTAIMLAVGYVLLAATGVAGLVDRGLGGRWSQRVWMMALGASVCWQLGVQLTLARTGTEHGPPIYGVVPFRLLEAMVEWGLVGWA